MNGSRILWLSKHEPTSSQMAVLQKMYGEDLEVDVVPPKETDRQNWRWFLQGKYNDWVVFLDSDSEMCRLIEAVTPDLMPLKPLAERCAEADAEWRTTIGSWRFSRFVRMRRVTTVGFTELGPTAAARPHASVLLIAQFCGQTYLQLLTSILGPGQILCQQDLDAVAVLKMLRSRRLDDIAILSNVVENVRLLLRHEVRPLVFQHTTKEQGRPYDRLGGDRLQWCTGVVRALDITTDDRFVEGDPQITTPIDWDLRRSADETAR